MSGYFNVLLQDARLRDFSNVVQGCSCTTRPFNGYVDYFSWPSFSNVQCVPFASMRFPTPSLPVTMLPPGIGVNVNSVSNQALTGNDISKLMYIPQNALPSQSQIPSMQNILEAMVLKSFAEEMGKKMAAEQLTQIPQQTSNIFNQNNQPSGAAQMNQNDMMQLMVIFMSMLTEMANMLKAAGNVGQGNTPSDSGNRTDSPVRTDSSSGTSAADSTNDSPSGSSGASETSNSGKPEGTDGQSPSKDEEMSPTEKAADEAAKRAKAAETEVGTLEKKNRELEDKKKDTSRALEDAVNAFNSATEKLNTEKANLKDAEAAYNTAIQTTSAKKQELDKITDNLGQLNKELAELGKNKEKNKEQITALTEKIKAKEEEQKKAKEAYEAAKKAQDEKGTKATELKSKVEQLEKEVKAAEGAKTAAERNDEDLQTVINRNNEDLTKAKAKADAANKAAQEAAQRLEEASRAAEERDASEKRINDTLAVIQGSNTNNTFGNHKELIVIFEKLSDAELRNVLKQYDFSSKSSGNYEAFEKLFNDADEAHEVYNYVARRLIKERRKALGLKNPKSGGSTDSLNQYTYHADYFTKNTPQETLIRMADTLSSYKFGHRDSAVEYINHGNARNIISGAFTSGRCKRMELKKLINILCLADFPANK